METNHVGITVGDLDAAITFYTSVFDLQVLVGAETASTQTPGADRRADVFGDRWKKMRIAHLATDSGMGIELFEFIDPAVVQPDEHFEYWRIGLSHLSFTVPDLEASIEAFVAAGGVARTAIHEVREGCRVCYCKDPWGTAIELSSGTYPETHPAA